jgi:hypothetical protein
MLNGPEYSVGRDLCVLMVLQARRPVRRSQSRRTRAAAVALGFQQNRGSTSARVMTLSRHRELDFANGSGYW